MKYELVLFDFDGTLADTFPWFLRVLDDVTLRFGLRRLGESDRQRLRELGPRQILDELGVPLLKLPLIARDVRRRMGRDHHGIALFPGIPELLVRLRAVGLELCIVSSNSVENVRAILGERCAGLVSRYACGTALFGKSRTIRRVLAETGVAARKTILVGDEIRDADAARRAGVAFGAVSWGYNTERALRAEAPDELFRSVGELADYLTRC